MRYTVKQLANLAGVTNRALHYYDEIGLLQPASYGDNGYRYYDETAVLRLQQILFYRELDIPLDQIKTLLDRPDFDLLHALEGHRRALLQRMERLTRLIETVDNTIKHVRGEKHMQQKDFYKGFDEERQKEYAREAEQRWGDTAKRSQKRWESFSPEQKHAIMAENHAITAGGADAFDRGLPTDSPEVQAWIERWFKSINQNFYTCTLEIFAGLANMYVEDERFTATYEEIRSGMAVYMQQAMLHYCESKK